MSDQLIQFIARHRQPLEKCLANHLPLSSRRGAERLNEALRYAVFPGGKRLRPMLTLLGANVVGDVGRALRVACAMEFLHTSSIILDDLPAMDDADLRRGRAALHLVYGESTALLAALSLLNQAYGLMAEVGGADMGARLVKEAIDCIGSDGMIGGQMVDLQLRVADGGNALETRSLKTTALMRLTMIAGAMAAGADDGGMSALAFFGERIGAAFQIRDDLLDEYEDSRLTGKTAGQDARHLRSNFAAELGGEEAYRLAETWIVEGKTILAERFGDTEPTRLLAQAADYIMRHAGRTGTQINAAV